MGILYFAGNFKEQQKRRKPVRENYSTFYD